MQVSDEEFAEWRELPVTQYVLGLMERWAERQKQEWAEMAWSEGNTDPMVLREAQVRADCYRELPASTLEDWQAIEGKLSDSDN